MRIEVKIHHILSSRQENTELIIANTKHIYKKKIIAPTFIIKRHMGHCCSLTSSSSSSMRHCGQVFDMTRHLLEHSTQLIHLQASHLYSSVLKS